MSTTSCGSSCSASGVNPRRSPKRIGDFALVAAQLQVTPGIGNDLGSNFLGNVPAEKVTEQMVLCLDVIVQRLDPEKRLDAGQQLFPVKGFAQKIVGACFDAADPIGNVVSAVNITTGRRRVASLARICSQTSYPDIPGIMTSSRTKIRRGAVDELECRRAVLGGDDFVLRRRECSRQKRRDFACCRQLPECEEIRLTMSSTLPQDSILGKQACESSEAARADYRALPYRRRRRHPSPSGRRR